ncbi:MAG: transporter, partial [Flavobacteriaceae bacterium]
TAGGNFIFGKNHPYPYGDVFDVLYRPIFYQNLGVSTEKEPFFSLRAVLATQSHFLRTWVFVTNFILDRYLTEQTAKSYILTLTHTFHPLWSVYLENEGLFSTRYNDQIFRTGAAYLFSDDIQIEGSIGVNTNTRPSALFLNLGISYRLNFHKDFISAAEIEYKESKKEEKELKKTMKKNNKAERKRARKAKRL